MYVLKREPVKYLDGTHCPESYISEFLMGFMPCLTFDINEAKKYTRKSDATKDLKILDHRFSVMKIENSSLHHP